MTEKKRKKQKGKKSKNRAIPISSFSRHKDQLRSFSQILPNTKHMTTTSSIVYRKLASHGTSALQRESVCIINTT